MKLLTNLKTCSSAQNGTVVHKTLADDGQLVLTTIGKELGFGCNLPVEHSGQILDIKDCILSD